VLTQRTAPVAGGNAAYILATAVYLPPDRISNEELVDSFNAYVAAENERRQDHGLDPLEMSSAVFVEDASGIKQRHVLEKTGILDPNRMVPIIPERLDDELSVEAEFALKSAQKAIAEAGLTPADIDLIICSAAHHQRPYPAIAIEIQKALGCGGAAFDMQVACSSTTFAMHLAQQAVKGGMARNVLVCSPEIMSGHLNFRDRKTHFIFGDASVSIVIGAGDVDTAAPRYEIIDTEIWTSFSSNIRSNFGFLNRASPETATAEDKLVTQIGNKVFKDIVFAASRFMVEFLGRSGNTPADMQRLWLHQANLKMLKALVAKMGDAELWSRVPIVLDTIANVAAPGSLVAFHRTKKEVDVGKLGLICSFGAGYSIGALLVRRVA
jgi:beta-ketodecanoyl-[acyl-carrier-protein] synthase